MILLDTHVLLWSDHRDKRLGRRTAALLERQWDAGSVAVAAISFWEIALLVDRERLQLPMSVAEYRDSTIEYGFAELALDGTTAIRAMDLVGLPDDPADRFIVATALTHDAMLVTGDERLLNWKHSLARHDART